MKNLYLLTLALLLATPAQAFVKNYSHDAKFQNQVMVFKQSVGTPAAGNTGALLTANDGAIAGSPVTITSGFSQPDVPRNIVVTPDGNTADVAAGNVTIAGKNILGESITEDLAFLANASTATTGSKAFASITSITFPAEDSPFGATWWVGYGEKIGLSRCLDSAGHLLFSTVAGAYEATRATVAVSASAAESNTADFNGTMNGSNSFEAFFIENYRCKP